jgi:hypothetical protein
MVRGTIQRGSEKLTNLSADGEITKGAADDKLRSNLAVFVVLQDVSEEIADD